MVTDCSKSQRLLLEQERQKASRSSSEVSRPAASQLSDKRDSNGHLLVSWLTGNALLVRNCIWASGGNYSAQTNWSSEQGLQLSTLQEQKVSLQRSLQMSWTRSCQTVGTCWPPSPHSISPKALFPKFLVQHTGSSVSSKRTHTQNLDQACSPQA